MNRNHYFDYIKKKLVELSMEIETSGKLNLLNLNTHSEIFFLHLYNIIFNLELENLNKEQHNAEGIDLVDNKNRIIAQVSATCSKQKIEKSLQKGSLSKYNGYEFKFIAIAGKAGKKLKEENFKNKYNIKFNAKKDIWDMDFILREIMNLNIEKLKAVYDFIYKELDNKPTINKVESNLATIINILSKEMANSDIEADVPDVIPFEIENKISFNDLEDVKEIIKEYIIYNAKLDSIYTEFDKEGNNKSKSVLGAIRSQYIKLIKEENKPKDIFEGILENVKQIIMESSNYKEMPIEELGMCVEIVVVDAFTRCKIFKKPEVKENVITG